MNINNNFQSISNLFESNIEKINKILVDNESKKVNSVIELLKCFSYTDSTNIETNEISDHLGKYSKSLYRKHYPISENLRFKEIYQMLNLKDEPYVIIAIYDFESVKDEAALINFAQSNNFLRVNFPYSFKFKDLKPFRDLIKSKLNETNKMHDFRLKISGKHKSTIPKTIGSSNGKFDLVIFGELYIVGLDISEQATVWFSVPKTNLALDISIPKILISKFPFNDIYLSRPPLIDGSFNVDYKIVNKKKRELFDESIKMNELIRTNKPIKVKEIKENKFKTFKVTRNNYYPDGFKYNPKSASGFRNRNPGRGYGGYSKHLEELTLSDEMWEYYHGDSEDVEF